jgi:hypothetical protein
MLYHKLHELHATYDLVSLIQLAIVCFQKYRTTPSHRCQFVISSSVIKYNILKSFGQLMRRFQCVLNVMARKLSHLKLSHILLHI